MAKSDEKKYQRYCPKCESCHVKKDGYMRWKQRYRCCDCHHVFQHASRHTNTAHRSLSKLWNLYATKKQTYKDLAEVYAVDIKTIQRRLDRYIPLWSRIWWAWWAWWAWWSSWRAWWSWWSWKYLYDFIIPPKHPQESVLLLIDTTYFGRLFGIMEARSAVSWEVLFAKIVDYETNHEYQQCVTDLQKIWWHIAAIICDGRRGLLGGFADIPTQMCIFHQVAIVRRLLTKKPKQQPKRDLMNLVLKLKTLDKPAFTQLLETYEKKWHTYLNQKTYHASWKTSYTHRKTRQAYTSLKNHLPFLFTWYDYPALDIPHTTAWLEGSFGHLKPKISIHRGLKPHRKQKLIMMLLKGI